MTTWTPITLPDGSWEGELSYLLTESGDYLLTESGDYLILEQGGEPVSIWSTASLPDTSWT